MTIDSDFHSHVSRTSAPQMVQSAHEKRLQTPKTLKFWQLIAKCSHSLKVNPNGTAQGERFIEDIRHAFRTALPFFRKWSRVPEDYETLYQQALSEMQQPDFVATWTLLTAWGNKPADKAVSMPRQR